MYCGFDQEDDVEERMDDDIKFTYDDYKELKQKLGGLDYYDDNIEAIKKYKELLDMGAITQEEFDQKKKEFK